MKSFEDMTHEYVLEILKTMHINRGHLGEYEIENIADTAVSLAKAVNLKLQDSGVIKSELIDGVDWSIAPEWANWAAMDKDGEWFWFEFKPHQYKDVWVRREGDFDIFKNETKVDDWMQSLQERQMVG